MQTPININKIRNEIDQTKELIIIGLKERSNYPLNRKTFNEQNAQNNIEKEIIKLYQELLSKICENIEDESTYKKSSKIDKDNILLCKKRIITLGEKVAEYKMQQNPELSKITNPETMLNKLIVPEREKEIIKQTAILAEKHLLTNVELIKDFAQNMIKLNTKVQVQKILSSNKPNKKIV